MVFRDYTSVNGNHFEYEKKKNHPLKTKVYISHVLERSEISFFVLHYLSNGAAG